jgi:2-succinyl-5-enolpyruvyl-6-hydroxy-3-cyclohexene-1-carboxylate synthase
MNAGDISLACTRVLVDELARQGVQAVCISPGSRSTPLTLAFARHGGFDIHVHLDERSSAFFALGRAKASGRPVALVCTSGTAAANYLPAIVEASQSRIPLLVLTADRPPTLRGTGANQTIDQRALYGVYVRLFQETPLPSANPGAARTWRAIAARAVDVALGAPSGPVHLNMPFDEPLTPSGDDLDLRDDSTPTLAFRHVQRTRLSDVTWLARQIEQTERGVILAGWMAEPAPAILDLGAAAGWPVLAEPHSNIRHPKRALSAPQAVLMSESFTGAHAPEMVLQFGGAPTSRASLALASSASRLITVDVDGWPADPARHAERIIAADAHDLAESVTERLRPRSSAWSKRWRRADATARAALDAFLDSVEEPFEPCIVRDVVAGLPKGSVLLVGNSTPIRDLDIAMAPRQDLRVLANRGASGIDGMVSTALGIASTGIPTTALIGDLTMLHDIGALQWGFNSSARFEVIDNGGGGIFDLLPSASLAESEALFVAPPSRRLHSMNLGPNVNVTVVERARQVELRKALRAAISDALA